MIVLLQLHALRWSCVAGGGCGVTATAAVLRVWTSALTFPSHSCCSLSLVPAGGDVQQLTAHATAVAAQIVVIVVGAVATMARAVTLVLVQSILREVLSKLLPLHVLAVHFHTFLVRFICCTVFVY